MHLVAVDIGNSSIKVAVESLPGSVPSPVETPNDRWIMESVIRNDEPIHLDLSADPAFWSICSVNHHRQKLLENWITCNRPADQIHTIDESEIGLKSNIESRAQTGIDRLVAAWMAVQLNDGKGPVIVIDAGTAVTIDLVDSQTIFQGGVIFPGVTTTLKSLSDSTDALPDLSQRRFLKFLDNPGAIIGKSTHPAIVRGVYHSQLGGIKHIVNKLRRSLKREPAIYATGGGIFDLPGGLPEDWNLVNDLVLRGATLIGQTLAAESK